MFRRIAGRRFALVVSSAVVVAAGLLVVVSTRQAGHASVGGTSVVETPTATASLTTASQPSPETSSTIPPVSSGAVAVKMPSGTTSSAHPASVVAQRPEAPWFAGRVGAATQVISVVGTGGSDAVLSTWQRTGDRWTPVIGSVAAKVGKPGISTSYGESSSATPAGVFSISSAFGRQPDPGAGISYRRVDDLDWWVSDVNSPLYNTYQRCAPGTCPFNEQVSENLGKAGFVYDYALVMGVNTARVPGAGSAFFLHVTNGAPTVGCVAVSSGTVVSILRWVRPGVVIAVSPR